MPTTHYLGFTKAGTAVHRKSSQDYGYTHAVALLKENGTLARLPTFSTSADGAWRNAASNHWRGEAELVEVKVVDAATYRAAKGDPAPAQARQEVEKAQPDLSSIASTRNILGGLFGTREGWLQAFMEASRPLFVDAGAPLPDKVRISVGFPSKGSRSKVIGECWNAAASADGVSEVFIVPGLQADPARIADVLTHELIHAALGTEEGHGPTFRRVMKRLGLEGKATATVAGDGWREWALPVIEALGPFPGAALGAGLELAGGKKTQTTRYLKVSCSMCEWTARVTAKHLEGRTLRCPDTECEGELAQSE